MSKATVTHGRGPVTSIVGRGQTVEVEWTPRIEALVDAGTLVVVGRKPRSKKPKPAQPVVIAEVPATEERFAEAFDPDGYWTAG